MKHAVALVLLLPSIAEAQLGGTFALRHVNGRDPDPTISQRNGMELRAFWDSRDNSVLGWRAEIGGVQVKYKIPGGAGPIQVSENSFELAALLRVRANIGALSGTYAVVGPLASARLNCGVSGGFVNCANNETRQLGYLVGLGYRRPVAERRVILFELRYADRVVGAASHSILTLGVGFGFR